jgi:hypothetical protein
VEDQFKVSAKSLNLIRESVLINVLKALTLIISMCSLHVTSLSTITPEI